MPGLIGQGKREGQSRERKRAEKGREGQRRGEKGREGER
jgi:hypothetical protein